MVRLSSTAEVVRALASARDVEVLSYTLRPGPVLQGLEAAARRGARVAVRLEGAPFADPRGALVRVNWQIVERLTRSGADAQLVHAGAATPRAPLHAKTLVADGRTFLDDRNFGPDDFIVSDSRPADGRALHAVLSGESGAPRPSFAIDKPTAIAREAALLRADGSGDAIVESETFGGGPVARALDALARRGGSPRLLVSSREAGPRTRERKTLERLAADGVRIRLCRDSEKFALAGERAWIGSANPSAAFGVPSTVDWGLCTRDRAIVAAARERIESRWAASRPLPARRISDAIIST
ncbi:MAG TPA: hypothetical protein VGF86_10535 [Candidatus Tumulicola sp.]|jgi:hypothetical protein